MFLVWILTIDAVAQEASKHALYGSLGPGASENESTFGYGVRTNLGIQTKLWNERLRWNQSMSLGAYSNKGITDLPDTYFNTLSLSTYLCVDVLKYKSVALMLGMGTGFSHSTGIIGNGGWPGTNLNRGFFTHQNVFAKSLIGLRINPKQKRYGFELTFYDAEFTFNKSYLSENVLHVGMFYHLNDLFSKN